MNRAKQGLVGAIGLLSALLATACLSTSPEGEPRTSGAPVTPEQTRALGAPVIAAPAVPVGPAPIPSPRTPVAPSPSPPLLIAPSPAAPQVQSLVDRANRRWTDLENDQQRALRELLSSQKASRDEVQQRISSLRQQLGLAVMSDERDLAGTQIDGAMEELNQLRETQAREVEIRQRDQKIDREAVRSEIQEQLRTELESLRLQLAQKQGEAESLRDELSRYGSQIRDLNEQIDQKRRDLAVLQQQLDQEIEQDQANYRRWESELQAGIQTLAKKADRTTYAEERAEYLRQVDRKTKEQNSLLDVSRRWQDRLARQHQADAHDVTHELTTFAGRLAEAEGRGSRLPGSLDEAERAVRALRLRVSAVEQLQSQLTSP